MISTKRLDIVEATESDIAAIMELERHKDNRDFIWSGTYDEHKAEIHDSSFLLLVFRQKSDGATVGFALSKLDFKSDIFELRRIAISEKGMGYGKEVMIALMQYAFEEQHMNRFWLDVYPDNARGIKLYESIGMHREGVLRQNYKSERGYLDQIIYSMLKPEYQKRAVLMAQMV